VFFYTTQKQFSNQKQNTHTAPPFLRRRGFEARVESCCTPHAQTAAHTHTHTHTHTDSTQVTCHMSSHSSAAGSSAESSNTHTSSLSILLLLSSPLCTRPLMSPSCTCLLLRLPPLLHSLCPLPTAHPHMVCPCYPLPFGCHAAMCRTASSLLVHSRWQRVLHARRLATAPAACCFSLTAISAARVKSSRSIHQSAIADSKA